MPSSNSRPVKLKSRPFSFTKLTALFQLIALMSISTPSVIAATGGFDHATHLSPRVSFQSAPTPDFTIASTSPTAVNVNQSAVSGIIINALYSFTDWVAITDDPSFGLKCGPITPHEVRSSGTATVSCSATAAGEYNLTLTGASGSLTHKATATFNFVDFKIQASSPTGAVNTLLSSSISIIALNKFDGIVSLSTTAQAGLACGLTTPSTIMGSGRATVSCNAPSAGIYILIVHATSSSLTHSTNATFDVADLPNFSLDASNPTTTSAGQPATSMITIKELNAFTDTVALTNTISPSLTCQPIMPATVQGSGTATISCNSNTAGTYALTITGTSNLLSHSATVTFNFVDFTITIRSSETSNVRSSTSSDIIIGSVNGFAGTVSLTDVATAGLTCDEITPNNVISSGMATILCNASIAGTYLLTVTGTSGPLTHSITATFKFTSMVSPDFTISATTPISFFSGSVATSSVTVTAENGFYSLVTLTANVSPHTGLSVSLNPTTFVYGSGISTASFSSSTSGSYLVTITGTYGSMIRTATLEVTVTPQRTSTPDVTLTPNVASLSFDSGTSGSATITVAPQSGFTGAIALAVATPAGISCILSPTSIQSSGTSILTCNSSTAGDYTVTILAAGGASSHTTTVNVHVAAVSPAASSPWTILGLAPATFFGIVVGIIALVVAGTVLVLRPRGSLARCG